MTAEIINLRASRKVIERIRDRNDGYRVATDAYNLAMDLGCSGDLHDALWALCEREAKHGED